MERYYWASLQMIPGLGNSRLKALITFFGSAHQVWQANGRELFFSGLISKQVCNNIISQREKIDVTAIAAEWEKKQISVCILADYEYPELLAKTFNPPLVLYYRGRLIAEKTLIAIVGARRASAYGRNAASYLSGELAQAGIGVVSGAARGVDTAAHQGALKSDGYTVAVLGCGVDVVYPPENAKLLAAISEQGLIVSEYAPGTPPLAKFFPARNRIISGLAKGVVVVEAAEKSGSLITADFALEEGRDVFAVPGNIFSAGSKGVNRLIKQGAKLVETTSDILEEYVVYKNTGVNSLPAALDEDEAMVFRVLSYDNPLGIEEIMEKVHCENQAINYILLQLELKGLIVQYGGQRFVRCAGRELFE
ncbi:MAG: protecting protein DprA [Firmicutes bacterium]|nr:protecting protein DprA [Bacillota bacterium]